MSLTCLCSYYLHAASLGMIDERIIYHIWVPNGEFDHERVKLAYINRNKLQTLHLNGEFIVRYDRILNRFNSDNTLIQHKPLKM